MRSDRHPRSGRSKSALQALERKFHVAFPVPLLRTTLATVSEPPLWRCWTACLAILLTGCASLPAEAPPADRSRPKGRPDPGWARCYSEFSPSGDAPADLERLTAACGPPNGLNAVTPVRIGALQAEDGASERFTFRARSGRCYRFFSVGTADVGDLDLAVLDPAGQLLAADVSDDRFPVVPPRGPLCVEDDGLYTVEVAVVRGSGRFVLQVWAD